MDHDALIKAASYRLAFLENLAAHKPLLQQWLQNTPVSYDDRDFLCQALEHIRSGVLLAQQARKTVPDVRMCPNFTKEHQDSYVLAYCGINLEAFLGWQILLEVGEVSQTVWNRLMQECLRQTQGVAALLLSDLLLYDAIRLGKGFTSETIKETFFVV